MLRFTFRNVAARKLRLVMSTLAIVLGVAFFAGVQTFSHGLSHTFDDIFKGSTASVVVQPKGTDNFAGTAATTLTLTPADVAKLAALPQVARADGGVGGIGMYLLDTKGKVVGATGAPTLAFNYTDGPNMLGEQMLTLHSGHFPDASGEIVLDSNAATRAGYSLGDRVSIIAPHGALRATFELVGTTDFYGGGTAGAILMVFDTPQAQALFVGGQDVYNKVDLTPAPGISQQELAAAAGQVLPPGFAAVTGDQIVKDSQDAVGSALGVLSTFLLIFAIIAVIVGGFIVVNTFSILVAQRSRELALLRALGASRRQVTTSVLLEALVMSIAASTLGILLGWALALGLAGAFRSFGLDVRAGALTLTPQTIMFAYLVGIVSTLVSAYLPARRAAKIPPVAAMQDGQPTTSGSLRRRALVGSAVLALGVATTAIGATGAPGGDDAAWVGVGAGICILTVALISSTVGQPVLATCSAVFGWIFRTPGRLAGENAKRDPRRTGATASALMIGLALVSLIGILAASLNRSVDNLVDKDFSADLIVRNAVGSPFPTGIGDQLEQIPGVATVARQQVTAAAIGGLGGKLTIVTGQDSSVPSIYHPKIISGRMTLRGNEAYVTKSVAADNHLTVGSAFTLAFPGGTEIRPTVVGIVEANQATGPVNVTLSELESAGVPRQDSALSIMLTSGADPGTVHAALDRVVAPLPIVTVQDKQEFSDSVRAQIDQLLYLIYALLALAIVIAVIGIINTLGLSVVERTRELGLLRAIGTSRRQVRGMVTLESVAIALLGALLGMALGVVFGVLLRQVLSDDLTSLSVPFTQLVVFLVISVIVGVLAAVVPAIRAGRLDVLKAISVE